MAVSRLFLPIGGHWVRGGKKRGPCPTNAAGIRLYAVIEEQSNHVATTLFGCSSHSLVQVIAAVREGGLEGREVAASNSPPAGSLPVRHRCEQERAPAALLIWLCYTAATEPQEAAKAKGATQFFG